MNPTTTAARRESSRATDPNAGSAEAKLDALLKLRARRIDAKSAVRVTPPEPIEIFRRKLETEFVPVLEELASKYISSGIILQWDVAGVLAGGRELTIEFTLPPHRTKLRGTLARDVMAFELTRFVSETDGAVSSGPMVRLRTLDQAKFREFVCDQISQMVQSILRVMRR